jgi:hypothetical protein
MLQRVLGAHADVGTVSEPWLLLPLLAPLRPDMPGASQRDSLIREALADFVAALPSGRADYLAAMRAAALELYRQAGPDKRLFVDKSPVYHLVVEELFEGFPDAKFVFLWRNPLAVMASAVELFDAGRWEVNRYTLALFQSLEDLIPARRRHADRSHAVRYEDLVGGGEQPWRELLEYLGLEYDPLIFETFAQVRLDGSKGDPTGTRLYSELTTAPLAKWREVVSNPVRRHWARRYLRWIGSERLSFMGYDLDELMGELDDIDVSMDHAADDLGRLASSLARDAVKAVIPPHSGASGAWARLLNPSAKRPR